jgi:gluconolactonase
MMHRAICTIEAERFATLPKGFHWTGEPNAWVKMTRPGQRLHSFLEGPCFDAAGRLLVVDIPYGRIFSVDTDGKWTLVLSYDGEPHAIRRFRDGYVVADHRHGLIQLDADFASRDVRSAAAGLPFAGLSDVAIDHSGAIWFTDPGRSSLSAPTGRLHRRAPDGLIETVLDHLPYPNGVAISADGAFVYLALTRANAVWRLRTSVGTMPPMAGVFLQLSGGLGPDGLAVDARGRIAVAQAQAGRAYVFDAAGDCLAAIRTDGRWTTATAFGPDGFLYIVEAEEGTIWRADLAILEV